MPAIGSASGLPTMKGKSKVSESNKVTVPTLGGEQSLNRYLSEIKKFPVLTAEQEYMLAKRYQEHQDPEAAKQLVGEDSGEAYRIGQRLTLRLAEANPVSGSLRFELPEGSYGTAPPRRDRTRSGGRRGRPANIRHSNRRR